MPSHINDHAPERETHKSVKELHEKVDALAEGQRILSEQLAKILEALKPDAAPPQRSEQPKPAGG